MATTPDLAKATDFIWRAARLLDRRRFDALFLGGPPEAVVEALEPYRNADGGFGNALEPDIRAPLSQPVPTWTALCILDETGGFGEWAVEPLISRACDYLQSITTAEGGVPFVLPSVRDYPRAPWWETDDHPPRRAQSHRRYRRTAPQTPRRASLAPRSDGLLLARD